MMKPECITLAFELKFQIVLGDRKLYSVSSDLKVQFSRQKDADGFLWGRDSIKMLMIYKQRTLSTKCY